MSRVPRSTLFLFLLSLLVPPASAAAQAPATLVTGGSIDRVIAAGEEQRFAIAVTRGQALKIAVDQQGADVAIELRQGSAPAATVDDASKYHVGRELLVWLAPADGTAQVLVRAKSILADRGGHYRIEAALFDASDAVAAAATALNEGRQRVLEPKNAGAARAEQQFQQAAAAWQALGDRELAASALYALGRVRARQLFRPADAVPAFTEALALYRALGFPVEIADTLDYLGTAQLLLGRPEQALAARQEAYAGADGFDPLTRAVLEDDIARVYQDLGDQEQAAEFGERAAATFHAAGAGKDEYVSLERLALTYTRMRHFDDAVRAVTRAIELGRRHGTQDEQATLMTTLGRIQLAAGDEDAALDAYKESLALFSDQASNRFVARLSLARLYDRRGDASQARPLLEQTLAEIPPQLRDLWAAVASELGFCLTLTGDPARALPLHQQALAIVAAGQSRFPELIVLRDSLATYRALGDAAGAETALQRAETIAATFPGEPYAAILLRERALNARAAGDLAAAHERLAEALDLLDTERGRLQSRALRTSFGGTTLGYYMDAIDVEMARHAQAADHGYDARAFELFERSRAWSLADLLAEARAGARGDVDPALVAERASLHAELARKDTALRELGQGPRARTRATVLARDLDDLARRIDLLDARIRASSPRYASLIHPRPATLADTQAMLGDGTVLLAFALGEKGSWAWAVTATSLRAYALPPAGAIEARARRVYADLTARQRGAAAAGQADVATLDGRLAADAAGLSDLVLGPMAAALSGEWRGRRLAVIGSGALEYVPLAALPLPRAGAGIGGGTSTRGGARRWLVDDHEVVQLPSVSVLGLLREERQARAAAPAAAGQAAGQVMVLADPVYSADDPRVTRPLTTTTTSTTPATPTTTAPSPEVQRVSDDPGTRGAFRRLVFSRDEAAAIARLGTRGGVTTALGFDANLQTIRGGAAARARILHIASHGVFNSARPELSGLVLSLVDARGRAVDGVLHLDDVFDLRLAADLVVLSGCETGLGREMTGEGLIGLTRAFMYAGAPRIVASLWQVDDLATAELMRHFYDGLFTRKLTVAAALADAQRRLRANPRWASPYYWAAFTLVGDWR